MWFVGFRCGLELESSYLGYQSFDDRDDDHEDWNQSWDFRYGGFTFKKEEAQEHGYFRNHWAQALENISASHPLL